MTASEVEVVLRADLRLDASTNDDVLSGVPWDS
eukprot:CAMPEP_0179103082 /NCGR_PEP_ID=MMETSP0796-20121207/47743_1 /TAXON_ID=73915 /ORGANISM="Pyrodinium bahamense, Strain pbaha01" /LENGTH=32 /DNA_ID= /DNA_START= /DNA_END= /DNA_ORIENTATION=